jgi:hypothetical protein
MDEWTMDKQSKKHLKKPSPTLDNKDEPPKIGDERRCS